MTEYEKMLAGQWYNPLDAELRQLRLKSRENCTKYNSTGASHHKQRRLLLAELLGTVGQQLFIEPPFFCDYGKHIHVGDNVFFNFNCVLLDVATITIGNNAFFGPAVQLYTVNHPLDAVTRRTGIEQANPITIGDDVWLGGGVIVCPGVTIGNRAVVAAGAVVTQDLAADGLYGGNPAKLIRMLNN
ncbi:maltose O-acetyltransferase [Alishewanella longhuensis]|uniref:Maltose O-acetyltransferase n=1 Tax=Alishewanella longhuensis TaxID=1091037 RepID=A0ABQ3L140_9ALTE|nr:sugar O-acetyltransferase [Alishewanella longhuensis]GHG71081.1 maltose O-acetyltransferase [Alishewanella longhuensis]